MADYVGSIVSSFMAEFLTYSKPQYNGPIQISVIFNLLALIVGHNV